MTSLADQQSFGKLLVSKKCEIIFGQTVLKLWLLNTARSAKVWRQFHGTFSCVK